MTGWRIPSIAGIPSPVEQAIRSLADLVGNVIPAGAISAYGGGTAPSGYLRCDGAAVSRSAYSALFSAIGTQWGAGDGSTTFNLPNLIGRFLQGALTPGTYGGSTQHNHGTTAIGTAGGAVIADALYRDHRPPYADVLYIIKT